MIAADQLGSMMNEPRVVTGYEDVDRVLHWFLRQSETLLGPEFVGMYLYGSLALGDFDPDKSDIDFIVVTEAELAPTQVAQLREMHTRFDHPPSGHDRVEAAYVERAALHTLPASDKAYPQVEKERRFFVEPLEIGWIFQCWTLREHGVVIAGPPTSTLIPPLDPDQMRSATAPVALMWQRQAANDPTWLPWLRERPNQAFVVLTLCRLLYTLESARVASKPAAARWAQQSVGGTWNALIAQALADHHSTGYIEPWQEHQTLALINYTVVCFRERFPSVD